MTILDEAEEAVIRRGGKYGHPAEDFSRVTGAARALKLYPNDGPKEHALYMILVKIARLIETPDHHDSLVDIAGYARNYEMILEASSD